MDDSTDFGTSSNMPIHVEIPGYRLRHLVDTDSLAMWFSAEQTSLGRKVTLRVLKPKYEDHPEARREFLAEMDRLVELDHPSLPRVLDTVREGTLVLVTQRVGVKTLEASLRDQKVGQGQALSVARDVAAGLSYLAGQGYAHKNVCPRLIVLRDTGGGRLVTFRNVVTLEQQAALKGRLAQDPNYIAPEQLTGPDPIGPTTPCYQIGALLFHMLAGRPPFGPGDAQEIARAHLTEEFPAIRRLQPFVNRGISNLIDACIQREPADRPDLEHVAEGLETLIEGGDPGIEPPPSSGIEIKSRRRRRRRRRR